MQDEDMKGPVRRNKGSIAVHVRLTRTELIDASLRIYFGSRYGKFITLVGILVPVLQWDLGESAPLSLLWIPVFALFCFPFSVALAAIRSPAMRDLIDTGFEYRLSAEGVRVERPHLSVNYGWPMVTKAQETEASFLLTIPRGAVIVLPKRCFRGYVQVDRARELLRTHVNTTKLL